MSLIARYTAFSILKCWPMIFLSQTDAVAKEFFNPHLLETTDTSVPELDLSLFAQDNAPPGDYNVDIFINVILTRHLRTAFVS